MIKISRRRNAVLFTLLTVSVLATAQQTDSTLITEWQAVGTGLEGANVTSMAFDAKGTLYAGLTDYSTVSLFALPRGSKTWRPLADGLPNQGDVYLTRANGQVLVFSQKYTQTGQDKLQLYRSTLSGFEWQLVQTFDSDIYVPRQNSQKTFIAQSLSSTGLTSLQPSSKQNDLSLLEKSVAINEDDANYISFIADGNQKSIFFASGNQIYLVGNSEERVRNPPSIGSELPDTVSGIIQSSNGGIYATSTSEDVAKRGIFRLSPVKKTWTNITANLPQENITDMAEDKSGALFVSIQRDVFVLPSGLTTWLSVGASSLPKDVKQISDMAYDPDGTLYIATDMGIFKGIRVR
jgi:hypothetical protein